MSKIIIRGIDFDNVTMEEAVALAENPFLRQTQRSHSLPPKIQKSKNFSNEAIFYFPTVQESCLLQKF